MASTTSDSTAGAARWRAAQIGLTTLLLRDLRGLRRLINPSRLQATMPTWIEAVNALVVRYAEVSATLAADFYDGEREAAEVPGVFTVPLADPPPDEQVDASMRWATKDVWDRDPEAATAVQLDPLDVRLDAAFVKADMATQKLVADVGRETVRQAVRQDREAVAYARVAALGACSFCKLMASRGSVYATAETAGREANERFSGDASVVKFHNNCVPAGTLVDGPAAEVGYRRWYEGELVIIGTAAGHELSITPNHPVLTDRGWVPAGLLSRGDYVLSSLNAHGSLLKVPNEDHVPSRIEDVWGALRVLGLVGMPVAAQDFHGDGTDGEVDVVRADGLLRSQGGSKGSKVSPEYELALARMGEGLLAPLGPSHNLRERNLPSACRRMRSLGQSGALFAAELGHAGNQGLAPASHGGVRLEEHTLDGAARDLVPARQREDAFASQVRRDDLVDGNVSLTRPNGYAALAKLSRKDGGRDPSDSFHLGPRLSGGIQLDGAIQGLRRRSVDMVRFDPSGLYGTVDGRNAYTRLGRDLGERLSGRVERDRVVESRRIDFTGHVYNLQTEQGWYRADGVVVSNCHCGILPVFRGQRFELSPHAARWDEIYREYAQGHPGDQLRLFRRALAEHDEYPLPGSH